MLRLRNLLSAAVLAALLSYAGSASAETIIDEWASVNAPPPPKLESVTVDPKTTALLVMDLIRQTCNNDRRPRCVASIPKVEKLIAAARGSGVTVIHGLFPSPAPDKFPHPVVGDILPAVAPKGDEPVFTSFVDKFILRDQDTGLQKFLKDKGITTVITIGTASHNSILFTSVDAALRGFKAIVVVDAMSGNNAYEDQAAAYILTTSIAYRVTLTTTDMIKFQ